MKVLYDPEQQKSNSNVINDLRNCQSCPKCGNDNELFGISSNIEMHGLLPYGYRVVDNPNRGKIFGSLFSLFDDSLWYVYLFKCNKCGCEWKSDPVQIIDNHGNKLIDESSIFN